jgi:hypothetical protein
VGALPSLIEPTLIWAGSGSRCLKPAQGTSPLEFKIMGNYTLVALRLVGPGLYGSMQRLNSYLKPVVFNLGLFFKKKRKKKKKRKEKKTVNIMKRILPQNA